MIKRQKEQEIQNLTKIHNQQKSDFTAEKQKLEQKVLESKYNINDEIRKQNDLQVDFRKNSDSLEKSKNKLDE